MCVLVCRGRDGGARRLGCSMAKINILNSSERFVYVIE